MPATAGQAGIASPPHGGIAQTGGLQQRRDRDPPRCSDANRGTQAGGHPRSLEPGGEYSMSSLDPRLHRMQEEICDDFELEWKSGKRPNLEAFLARAQGPARCGLLFELLAIELHYRQLANEQPERDEYLHRFPDDAQAVIQAFALPLLRPAGPCDTEALPEFIGPYRVVG